MSSNLEAIAPFNSSNPSCHTCIYVHLFERHKSKPYFQCRRYPKTMGEVTDNKQTGGAYYRFIYPIVQEGEYCGEWKDSSGVTFVEKIAA